jgi:hypothetical protein
VKKIIAVILLLVFTLQTFYTTAFTVWFYANRKAIAKELCINKNQPELKCEGKCFLNKQLKETSQHQDEEAPLRIKQLLEGSLFTVTTITHTLSAPAVVRTHTSGITGTYSYDPCKSIFHPPAIA